MEKKRDRKREKYQKREDIAGEYIFSDAVQIMLLLIFISAICIDLIWLNIWSFLRVMIPTFVRILVGIPIIGLSLVLIRSGLNEVFTKHREKLEVINTGVFSLMRHPIYTGTLMMYLGVLLLTFSVLGTLVWFAAIGFYFFISRYEEGVLIEKLGKEYETYMESVGMFIPRRKK